MGNWILVVPTIAVLTIFYIVVVDAIKKLKLKKIKK
jgi:hypothetical protein